VRIAYFVHGRGRGHASRTAPILAGLRDDGHDLTLFAGGDALELLGAWPELVEVPAVLPGARGTLRAPRRLGHDVAALRRLRPDLLVSDGDPTSLIAARMMGLRTVSIGHSLIFRCAALPPELPREALAAQRRGVALPYHLGTRLIASHFLPAVSCEPRARIARPLLRESLAHPDAPRGAHFVAYFRDRNGAAWLRALVAAGAEVRCFGHGDLDVPGVRSEPFSDAAFDEALRTAQGIVASSGSNLCAEAVALQRPMLAVYRTGDHEQELNALMMQAAGTAFAHALEEPPEPAVARFLAAVAAEELGIIDLAAALPDTVTAMRATLRDLER
jgi:UDP-N-acetylglucosamine--N-acetylmuramyl-(pentapeptide) pyrophosphoryl-undecaprenol N-acetylglucosamine transferase